MTDAPEHDSSNDILREIHEGVAWITLNRPESGNALTAEQRETFLDWIEQANEDNSTRCLVVQATGRFFCTGADLRSHSTDPAPREVGDVRRAMLRGAISLVNAILDCEKPVIASVQGTAAGIGAHLAFACDLVVAAEDVKFIEVFARRGLMADGLGTWLLPRLIGLARAKELVLLAEDVPAGRAQEIGLIARVVPPDDLVPTVADLARRLAEGPTKAHGANKWLLNRSLDLDRQSMAGSEAWLVDVLSRTADAEEGVASFVERRPVRFRGV